MGINKTRIKTRIIFGITSGLVFALLMWAFDYYNNEAFNIYKFVFHFAAFGLFQGLASVYYIKQDKKNDNK